MPPKKHCTTPYCKKPIGHIGNCTNKEVTTFTRHAVQKPEYYRRPPGPAPRDPETHVKKIWNFQLGKWITPVIYNEDPRIAADSLVALASPVSETNVTVAHVLTPQIQIISQDVLPQASQGIPQPAASHEPSFASLLQQVGAKLDAQMDRIIALESKIRVLETAEAMPHTCV